MLAPIELAPEPASEAPAPPATGVAYFMGQTDAMGVADIRPLVSMTTPSFFVGGTTVTSRYWSHLPRGLWGRLPFQGYSQTAIGREESQYTLGVTSHWHAEHGYFAFVLVLESINFVPAADMPAEPGASVESAGSVRGGSARVQFPIADEASRLRDLAGLDPGTLAEIFGVSRQAYYGWQTGAAPRPGIRQHVVEVLALVVDAARRLGEPRVVGNWLLTPSSPGGRRPVDYLRAREYEVVRGLLIRVRTRPELARPLPPGKRLRRELPPDVREAARRRLRRPRSPEDDLPMG